jgi:spore coat protein U-like protein
MTVPSTTKQVKYGLYKDAGYQNYIDRDQGIISTASSVTLYLQAVLPADTPIGAYRDVVNLTVTY